MRNSPTIFIVDDDEAVRDSTAALLETHGLQTEAFASATAFLARYPSGCTGCLLLDVRLPGMTGLELQEYLASWAATLPVIIITGHGDVPMAVKAMKLGACDFLEKPFSDDEILGAIGRALAAVQQAEQNEDRKSKVAARLARLTPREREVLDHLVEGDPNKVIAFDLGISARTVEVYRARVMDKMQARSLSHLVRMALTAGLGQNSP